MMQKEFEELTGFIVSNSEYALIERLIWTAKMIRKPFAGSGLKMAA